MGWWGEIVAVMSSVKVAWKAVRVVGLTIGRFFDKMFDTAPTETVLEGKSSQAAEKYFTTSSPPQPAQPGPASAADGNQRSCEEPSSQQRAKALEDELRQMKGQHEEERIQFARKMEEEQANRRRMEEEQVLQRQEQMREKSANIEKEQEEMRKRAVEALERQRAWQVEDEERRRRYQKEDEEMQERARKIDEQLQRLKSGKAETENWHQLANLKMQKEILINKAKTTLGLDLKQNYNFGFAGPVNCGKSTLVNALRGVKKEDMDYYAEVNVTEVKNPIMKYQFKQENLKRLVFWDIPGYGSPRLNMETFYKDNFLFAFDCLFLIVGETDLSNSDVMFARQAIDAETDIAFIKSKSDLLVSNHESDDEALPKFATKLETATFIYHLIKEKHYQNCPDDLKDIPYFLISSRTIAFAYEKVTFDESQEWRMVFDEMNLSTFMAECARKRVPQLREEGRLFNMSHR